MATLTPNLNLKKPAGTDYVRIGDFNDNANVLDAAVGSLGQLQTAQKTNLVLAINEAAQSGGTNGPYIDETTKHWMVWSVVTGQYVDTGIDATGLAAGFGTPLASVVTLPAGEEAEVEIIPSGPNTAKVFSFEFAIPQGDKGDAGTGLDVRGTYATVAALRSAVPSPEQGWMYNVGSSAPYNIYMWDAALDDWADQGVLQGPAGRGVVSIVRTSGTGAPGTTDTYTVTYSDSTTSQISVYNGANGQNGAAGSPGPNEISTNTVSGITGLLKGAADKVAQAVAGTDYEAPPTITVNANAAPALGALAHNSEYRCTNSNITTAPTFTIPSISSTSSRFYAAVVYKSPGTTAPAMTNNSGYTAKWQGLDVSSGTFAPKAGTVYRLSILFDGIYLNIYVSGVA